MSDNDSYTTLTRAKVLHGKRRAGTYPVTPRGIVVGMSDDAFYRPNRPPAPPRPPKPGEPFWSLRHDHVTWSRELRFHGESYGWEAQILREGALVIGQWFVLRQMAEQWAEKERKHLERGHAELGFW